MSFEISESAFGKMAGWEAMKRARAYLAQGQVLSSYWAPPLLRGVVQVNGMSFRASMVIHNEIDVENLCTCREARESGVICAHSVGVGLHWLQSQALAAEPQPTPGERRPAGSPAAPGAGRRPASLRRDSSGEPAELFFILPPNIDQAIAAGKIMLVVEGGHPRGRGLLNAMARDRGYAFSPRDERLLERLEEFTGGEPPGMIQLPAKDFASLLPLLVEHPNVTLGKNTPVKVASDPLPLPWEATLEQNGEIVLRLRGGAPKLALLEGWTWNAAARAFQPVHLPGMLSGNLQESRRISRTQVPMFLGQHWPQLAAAGAQANFKLDDFKLEPQSPKFLLELEGGLAQLIALLQCSYGSRIMTVGVTSANEEVWLPDPERPAHYSTRDVDAEREALSRLLRAGFSSPDGQGRMRLAGQNAVLNFFAREYPKLEREWTVRLQERLEKSRSQNIERIEPRVQITSSGIQWFDLGVVFESSGGQQFSPAEIQRLLLSGQGHTRLRNGKVAVLDLDAVSELQEVLRDCAPQQHSQGYRINNTQAGFVEATLREQGRWRVEAPEAWRNRAARQSGRAEIQCPPLFHLDSVLRPYQKQGVSWLKFLRDNGFGGILADEMGLGKTLQVLALLNSVRLALTRSDSGGPRKPMLVVCPTSLVYNWIAEARKFVPDLKALALHGPGRHEFFARIPEQDLVVSSYALIRRDAERYREFEFDTVVLDEAQHIKNRETQNAQAVKSVRAQHRLVLTGTPLENSVLDLWSIFDFLMPGYLGTAQDFRERYEQPITRDKDPKAQVRLARRLRPFLLRRLKRDVAADLPEKIEQVSFCELTAEQRAVYQQVIELGRKEVLDAVGAQGLARSRMVVLNVLLRLRQVCCDLRLLKLEPTPDALSASGKLDLFGELLEEVIDGGHRVLVFSQFVSMLALLKERLGQEKVPFCYLDGSTVDRAKVVNEFQSTPGIPVFLISLKAGGVGLNLTGADTVIHFDPWWNPAVEDQATDRAHRIGQTRVVTSYKLIARDTVEEKILALQNRKRELIRATIAGDDEFATALNWDEIQELLS
jgi:superfamily II DNA or RNA helicase